MFSRLAQYAARNDKCCCCGHFYELKFYCAHCGKTVCGYHSYPIRIQRHQGSSGKFKEEYVRLCFICMK